MSPTAAGVATVEFDLWYDTEAAYDVATFETSNDGGQTWTPVAFTLRSGGRSTETDGKVSGFGGRVWSDATAALHVPAGEQLLRWRYDTDGLYQGRGVYIDGVKVLGPAGERLDDPSRYQADGWSVSRD